MPAPEPRSSTTSPGAKPGERHRVAAAEGVDHRVGRQRGELLVRVAGELDHGALLRRRAPQPHPVIDLGLTHALTVRLGDRVSNLIRCVCS